MKATVENILAALESFNGWKGCSCSDADFGICHATDLGGSFPALAQYLTEELIGEPQTGESQMNQEINAPNQEMSLSDLYHYTQQVRSSSTKKFLQTMQNGIANRILEQLKENPQGTFIYITLNRYEWKFVRELLTNFTEAGFIMIQLTSGYEYESIDPENERIYKISWEREEL